MRLYIKHMVCLRCKIVVKEEFAKLGLECAVVELGVVEISKELSSEVREILRVNLAKYGLELYGDKKTILSEQIKTAIVEMIYSDEIPKINYSEYLSKKLNCDYNQLANIFPEEKGITIQQFIVKTKVERVKELLLNTQLSLTEISYKLNYSSVAHLSNQFKKTTGCTPSSYREILSERRLVNQ